MKTRDGEVYHTDVVLDRPADVNLTELGASISIVSLAKGEDGFGKEGLAEYG